MKITKTRLKEIIKEEVVKIFEAKHKDEEVSGVKVVAEEEEIDEMSMMSGSPVGAVAGHSGAAKKKEPLEEEDGWDEPHV